jgi:hypothetical protein
MNKLLFACFIFLSFLSLGPKNGKVLSQIIPAVIEKTGGYFRLNIQNKTSSEQFKLSSHWGSKTYFQRY